MRVLSYARQHTSPNEPKITRGEAFDFLIEAPIVPCPNSFKPICLICWLNPTRDNLQAFAITSHNEPSG